MVARTSFLAMLAMLLTLLGVTVLDDPRPWVAQAIAPPEPAPEVATAPIVTAAPTTPALPKPKQVVAIPDTACSSARLLGTLVSHSRDTSYASLEEAHGVRTVGLGDVTDCGTVLEIDHDRVVFRLNNGGRAYLETGGPRTPLQPPVAGIFPPRPDGSYELRRADLEELLTNPPPELLATGFVPFMRGGAVAGYRLRFGQRSPLAQLGLQSGDVVQKVNGIALTGPGPAIDVYQRLREGGVAELELDRGGAPVTVRYVIR